MNVQSLLSLLDRKGIQIHVDQGELVVRAARGAMDRLLVDSLRLNKRELVRELERRRQVAPPVRITPDQLTLVELGQDAIDAVVATVDGGAANVQDIYPLAPLQHGILFHHLLEPVGDPYLLFNLLGFATRRRLEQFVAALQQVVDRHDVLRTGFAWDGLDQPVQVVRRRAKLTLDIIEIDPARDVAQQLAERFDPRRHRIDVREAPLLRFTAAEDLAHGRWVLHVLVHHLVSDHTTLERILEEARVIERGQRAELPEPAPFRDFIAQATRGISQAEHEAFFREMLGDVDEPTAPFGVLDVQVDGARIVEAHLRLDPALAAAIRSCARRLRVNAASLLHVAWALVLARTSGRRDVVFGTLLFGRMQGGVHADRALGLFINTLPIRITVGDDTAEQAIRATHARLVQLSHHEHAPLVAAQRCSALPARTPLFTSLLNYRYSAHPARRAGGGAVQLGDGIELIGGHERTTYPVSLDIDDLGDDFVLTAQALASIGPGLICELMVEALGELVRAVDRTPALPVRALDVLPDGERARLRQWSAPATAPLSPRCLHELFEIQATAQPEAIALVDGERALSYREVDARASRLAAHLRALGVAREARVALYGPRSPEVVIAMLAVLKAGGAYVPLDPSYPAYRLIDILADCEPAAVVHAGALPAEVAGALGSDVPTVALHGDPEAWSAQPAGPAGPAIAAQLAYVIYTSGSTGRPKGVMVEHRAAVNQVRMLGERVGLAPGVRMLQFASLAFDASVEEVFGSWACGATLVLRSDAWLAGAREFWGLCAAHAVNVVDLPTQFFCQLAAEPGPVPACVRWVIIGGEAVSERAVASWFASSVPRPRLLNTYGPTEATVSATLCELTGGAGETRTIGRPSTNTQLYILDDQLRPAPTGVAGELYIGGVQVARGYLNRPELTAERFIDAPFPSGGRLYRTGDLGRWQPDGTIEYLGRNDAQVKLRGFRVEPGEVEARLAEVAGVRAVVVVAREDVPGDQRLVAYYVGDDALHAETLRQHAVRALPAYMAPAAYVKLAVLPVSANGKLDRKALPAPEAGAYARGAYEPPEGAIEQRLAELWAGLLGVTQVGRRDNFFDLGGHSLIAVQLVSRVRRAFEVELSLGDLFSHPVFADMAGLVVGAARSPLQAIPVVDRSAGLALSLAQQRLWFLTQLEGASEAYHITGGVRLTGALDRDAVRRALVRIVERHEALRACYRLVDGQPVQRVIAPGELRDALVFDERDLRGAASPDDAARVLGDAHGRRRFELTRELPLRALLIRVADDRHELHVTIHHLAADGWSVGVLLHELSQLYGAFVVGQPDPLPPLAIQYADYAAWQRSHLTGRALEVQCAFWRRNLAGAPTLLELPADRARPAQPDHAGASLELMLPAGMTAQLRALSRRCGVTLYATMLASWAAVLGRLSNQPEVVIGSPVAGRSRPDIEPLIGCFVNTLALRIDLQGSPSVSELLARVMAQVLATQAHQDLPFDQVVEVVKPPRNLAHTPVFQVMVDWQSASDDELDMPGLAVTVLAADQPTAQFDLTVSLRDDEDGIAGVVSYATALFDRSTIERYVACWQTWVAALVDDDRAPIDALPVLPAAARDTQLVTWNTPRAYPHARCVHHEVELQAARTPGAIAVVHGTAQRCYGELNARANQLARYLRLRGVGADRLIAICLGRGIAMVETILAIVKAGGAYVPLDPAYASSRLGATLQDCQPTVLVIDDAGRAALGAEAIERAAAGRTTVIDLAVDAARWAALPAHDLEDVGLRPQHLMYVIYTSGSTGQPKGVMVEHAQVARLFEATQAWYEFGASDVWTLLHSIGFDFSVWELWGALRYGGRLVIVPLETARSPGELYDLVCDAGVTVLNQTPSAFHQLIAAQARSPRGHRLRTVVFGGEVLELRTLKPWYARNGEQTELVNMYGITETTVHVTYRPLRAADADRPGPSPIGVRIPDLRLYVLDAQRRPVPVGVTGELYVGGAGVARGYLNRPELTAERFIADPFVAGGRLYRTGDLGRWLVDGTVEYLGRNDLQVKIRGFRIELGEIEVRLAQVAGVREVVVVARDAAAGDRRLVAYYTTTGAAAVDAEALRAHAALGLPPYMVPSAYVTLAALPLTPNGKLDRDALPAPEAGAYAQRAHEPPQGEIEHQLAAIWAELLQVEQVGRHDNFFELGGHSLLVVQLIERMRRAGLRAEVSALFMAPTLAELALAITQRGSERCVPPNLIPDDAQRITPEMLTLVILRQAEIDAIVAGVDGGAANVQDIYPLAPLQDGILFHHLMHQAGDPYLVRSLLGFASKPRLDGFLAALQQLVDRHDILRTAIAWEGLDQPVQVVSRRVALPVEVVELDPTEGGIIAQLETRFDPRYHRLDVRRAPLLRCEAAHDPAHGRWVLSVLSHHLIDDNTTFKLLVEDARALENGRLDQLAPPVPFRNFVAQARFGVSQADHEAFFTEMLGEVRESTAPFGLLDTQGGGAAIDELQRRLPGALSRAIRAHARSHGVGAASVIHLAWALVLARTTGRRDVVFGTVLLGRMAGVQSGRVIGPSINTLPIRISVDDQPVAAAVKRTHVVLAQLLRHEHAPLVLAQRCSALPAQVPLFTSLLNYRHSEELASDRPGLGDDIELLGSQERTNFPLTMSVDDLGEGFTITALVSAPIDAARVCDLMQGALEQLVCALDDAAAQTPVGALDVLPAAERARVVGEWNATARAYPQDRCIHELVEAHAARSPGALAVEQGGERVSYRELNARANRLARHLRGLGVGPDRLVAICAERSVELVVAMLAIVKAGGAYVPIDPSYPAERVATMLRDAAPVAVLSQARVAGRLPARDAGGAPVIDLGVDDAWRGEPSDDLGGAGQTARDLAYVIYTSGSTGTPKGVMIEHRSLHNLVAWHVAELGLRATSRSSSTAGVGFDAMTWEIWPSLCSGGALVLLPVEAAGDAEALLAWWRAQALDVSFLVTPLAELAYASGRGNPRLGTLLVGGDRLRRWPAELADGQALINNYGPTETTVVATSGRLARDGALHIGRPIANTQVYVLDGRRQPAPIGVAGELYIAGDGVARGYLNQPGLTAERFIDDPFTPGQRMYRSGDLARWRADGTLEYLGRDDHQVKLRGFRIELGEIEAQLAQVAGVREVVVVARQDASGDARLVAYYSGDDAVAAAELAAHAATQLPAYMVPSSYVRLAALPVTANGKLDRGALPAPDGAATTQHAYAAPRDELEHQLATLWAEVLHVDQVGRHDNFFALGGHSLLAVQLMSRLRKLLEVELKLIELFDHPVLSELADRVRHAARSRLQAIPHAERGQPLALSLAQQRLWFLTQLEGASEAYHISDAVRLTGALDCGVLQRALSRVVERHEVLRTCYQLVDGQPMQIVLPRGALVLDHHDVRDLASPGSAARALGEAHASRRFALERELPLRIQLVRVADDVHLLHVTMHHIASDGWSVGVLIDELSQLYRAYLAGEQEPLPPLAVQYADYAVWQRGFLAGDELGKQREFWRANLAGAPAVIELPTDRPRPAQQDHAGACLDLALSAELTDQLRALSRRHGVTLYMTMLASWAAVLARFANQDEVVIGSPVAGRNRTEIEPLIGFFVNTLALRIDLRGDPTVSELLARTRAQVLDAQLHQDLPFDQVVEVVKPPRSLAHPPLFQVMLDWHNTPDRPLEMPGLTLAAEGSEPTTAQFDLSLSLTEGTDRIAGTLNYATAVFDRETAARYVACWQQLVTALVAEGRPSASRRVGGLPLLPDAERDLVITAWNATDRDHGATRFVHELVERQAQHQPERVAVDDGACRLSYRELDAQANQLAHHLRACGVVPDARVALCAPRGAAMVVGLLAVMKAGGAYVPLDVAYPADRIDHMLRDSAPVVILTVGAAAQTLIAAHRCDAIVLDVEADAASWRDQPVTAASAAAAGLAPSHLAYVIYTSGSTGTPKGVMIEHGNLTNYTLEAVRWFELTRGDVVAQQNSLNFDLSLEEALPALAAGGCLVPRAEPFGSSGGSGPRPTMVHLTAAHWHSLVGAWCEAGGAPAALAGVRMINVTGDALSPHKLAQWEALRGDTRLINTYGPTEVTVSCSAAYVRHEPSAVRVSIGKPFANTRMYVLDRSRAPVPIGVTGELYLSGRGVGRGYLNLPELTAERFLDDPFWPGERMYRSGDLVRWRADGELEFIGRNDHQVKVRGFRIELGDVEAKLAGHRGVEDVAVIAREDGAGDKRLVAYYTGAHAPDPDVLRAHAADHLPAHMVPSVCVRLDALPVTPNGKLDRQALPAPDAGPLTRAYEPPQGDVEQAIAQIWAELLGLDRVGRHDDFFELGGHSLLAIRVVERLRRAGLPLDVTTLFTVPTPAALAAATANLKEIVL
jgi:amino acid adenylation domain-containing protein